MKTITSILLLAFLACVTVGCASATSGNVYARHQAQMINAVDEGEVVDVRHVQIEGCTTGLGSIAGTILGFVVGGTIGEGSGQDVAEVAGAITGALVGAAAEESVSRQPGLEIVVQLDYGEVVAVVQQDDQPFLIGDRVRIITSPDGSARVVP